MSRVRDLAMLACVAIVMVILLTDGVPMIAQSSPMPVYLPLFYAGPAKPLPPYPNKGVGGITQMSYSCVDVVASGAGWMLDWSMHPKDCGIPVVCQAWGLGDELIEPDAQCEIVILWNEPGVTGQANISPQVAAERWLTVENQRSEWDKEISTPCDMTEWLSNWADIYRATNGRWPIFDYVCIHSYPAAYTAQRAADATMAAVDGARAWSLGHGGDGRVILHEFAVWPAWGKGITEEYIRLVLPRLDESDVMYAWFALSDVGTYITGGNEYYAQYYDTSLVEDGTLTQLGQAYLLHYDRKEN